MLFDICEIINLNIVQTSAYAPGPILTTETQSTTRAYIPDEFANDPMSSYNVYWYNVAGQAFGFSSESTISLTETFGGDRETSNANDRLSWSLNNLFSVGGYRVGPFVELRNDPDIWFKAIYWKNCTWSNSETSTTPTVALSTESPIPTSTTDPSFTTSTPAPASSTGAPSDTKINITTSKISLQITESTNKDDEDPISSTERTRYDMSYLNETSLNVNNQDSTINPDNANNYVLPLVVVSVILFVVICIIIICVFKYKKHGIQTKAVQIEDMIMSHPMVVLIGIGEYQRNPSDPDVHGERFVNLPVDIDLRNLSQLFAEENLNYEVFEEIEDEKHKIDWTQDELTGYLENTAQILNDNVSSKKYDGLIVVISCHGKKDNICTSDYKLVNKVAVHRVFSAHFECRTVPRIFIYDCCDGSGEYGKGSFDYNDSEQSEVAKTSAKKPYPSYSPLKQDDDNMDNDIEAKHMEVSKAFEVEDVEEQKAEIWPVGSVNPDNLLAEIHASNVGFESLMHKEKGSYVIRKFVEKVSDDLRRRKSRYIFEIFDEIQEELKERQQIRYTYLNNTRYIKFRPHS